MRNNIPEIVKELRKNDSSYTTREIESVSINNSNSYNAKIVLKEDSKKNPIIQSIMNVSDESHAMVVITDVYGSIIYVNKRFTAVTGYDSSEVIGKNPRIFKSDDHPDSFYEKLWNTITSGHIWIGEIHNKRKDGTSYWEYTSITPILDGSKNITHYYAIKEEITNKKEIEKNLHIKDNALLSSINALVLTDLDGNITYVNPSFLGMWGYDSEKRVIGQPVYSLWKEGGGYVKIMDDIVTSGGWIGEVVAKAKNGKLFHVQMSASMVKDEFDKPMQIMASFVDITNQKRLEKKFRKFKTISDEADYGSIIYDLEGTILYVNASFATMHGYDIHEIIGKNLSMFYTDKTKNKMKEKLFELQSKGRIVGEELWHVTRDAKPLPLLMTATVINEPSSVNQFAAGTVIDITERMEAERKICKDAETLRLTIDELQEAKNQLAALNHNLEQEVEKRTEKIRGLIKQKDDFINQLGHDLKTPLTPMYVLLPIIKDSLTSDEDKESVGVVIRNVHFMKELVEKTIDLARLNSETIELSFETIVLKEFVTRTIEMHHTLFAEHNVTVENHIRSGFEVFANALRLQEIFNNLITNAVKYIGEGKRVIIIDAQDLNDIIKISVEDTGIGMTEEHCAHIFDEFYKVDESRHNLDSTGLGLTITKKIIEKHGGTIWVESPGIDKGTTVYFTLNKSNRNKTI